MLRIFFALLAVVAIIGLGIKIYDSTSSSENALSPFTELSQLQELSESDGSSFETSSLLGKNLVVNFFASWCEPCKREIIEIQKIHSGDYRSDDTAFYFDEKSVLFVGINSSETDEVKAEELISETGASYLMLFGDDGTLLQEVGAVGLPFTIFVDGGGKIVGKHLTAMSAPDVLKLMKKYFN